MVVIAAGVPCRWTAWAFEALRLVAATRDRVLHVRYVDRMDRVSPPDGDTLFLTQYPNPSLAGLAKAPDTRFLLFRDSVTRSVAHLMGPGGTNFMEALRAVGASCALIKGLTAVREPLDVPLIAPRQALDLIQWFGRVLHVKVPEERAAAVLRQLGPPPDPAASVEDPLDEDQKEIAGRVLGALYGGLSEAALPTSTWPYAVFLSGDRPDTGAEMVTEITGAARILYYGPYFHLPFGRWSAQATLGFSPDAAGTPFALEAHSSGLLGRAAFRPEKAGVFAVTMRFLVEKPEEPIEIRLRSDRGAIEGQIALAKLDLQPDT